MMGLGFTFGSKDKGLGKTIDKTAKGVGLISNMVKGIGRQAGKFSLGNMLAIPNQALGAMQSVAADTRVTTTLIEDFGVQADKSSRMAIAGLNLTAKESKKARGEIAGTAFSMNVDVGSVANAWKSLKQAQIDVTKVGFKSFKQYQKFLSVTGTDAQEFASSMAFMQKTLGLTNEETEDLIQTTIVLGKKFDMGAEAVPAMIKNMKAMRETGAALFKEWGKERTTKFLHSTTLVSGAFMKAGHTAEEAGALGQGLLKTLMKGEAGFHSLYTGLETTLPGFAQVLSENLMGPQQALAALQKSPTEFISFMNKAIKQVDKIAEKQVQSQYGIADASELSGERLKKYNADVLATQSKATKRFSQQMAQHLGPETTDLIMSGFGSTSKQIKELEGNYDKLGGKKGAVAGLSKQYRDGRNATTRFAIAQARLVTKMKNLTGTMSNTKFLSNYSKSSKLMAEEMEKVAKKGGPAAKMMTTLIDLSNFGLGGVLSKLHPMGPALTTVIQKFGPYLQMLPAVAIGVKALLSPFALLTAAIGGVYLALKYPEQAAKAFKKFSATVKKNLPKILSMVKMIVVGVAKTVAKVMVWIWENIDWGQVKSALIWTAEKVGQILKWALLGVLRITEWLIQAFGNINFDVLRGYLAVGFKYAFYAIVLAVIWVVKQLPDLFIGAMKVIFAVIIGFFDGLQAAFSEQFPRFAAYFEVFFTVVKAGFIVLTAAIIGHYVVIAAKAAWAAGQHIAHTMRWVTKGLYQMAVWKLQAIGGYVAVVAKAAWAFAAMVAKGAIWVAREVVGFAVVKLAGLAYYVALAIGYTAYYVGLGVAMAASFLAQGAFLAAGAIAWAVMWLAAAAPIVAIIAAIAAIGVAIYTIVKYWDEIVGFFKGLGKSIGRIFKKIGGFIVDVMTAPIKMIIAGYEWLADKISGIASSIGGFFSDLGGGIADAVGGAIDFVSGATHNVTEGVMGNIAAMKKMSEQGKKDMKALTDDVKKNATGAVVAQAREGKSLASGLGGVLDKVKDYSGKAADTAVAYLSKMAKQSKKEWSTIQGKEFMEDQASVTEKFLEQYNVQKAVLANPTIGSDQKKAVTKSMKEAADEYEKITGRILSQEADVAGAVLGTFSKVDEAIGRLAGRSKKEAASLAARKNALIDAGVAELKLIEQQLATHKITTEKAEDRKRASEAATELATRNLAAEVAYSQGSLEGLQTFVNGEMAATERMSGMLSAIASSHLRQLGDDAKTAMSQINNDEVRAELKKITELGIRGFNAKLELLKKSATSPADFEKKAKEAKASFAKQQAGWHEIAVSAQRETNKGVETASADATKQLENLTKDLQGKIGDGVKSTLGGVATTVHDAFGLTGREAANFLKALTGVKPADLKKSLGKIKKSYLNFLKMVGDKGKKLLKVTRTEFKSYHTEFEDLWKKMEQLTKDYTRKIQDVSTKFWVGLVRLMMSGTSSMTVAAASMIASLEASFHGFNLLDILTSGGKIRDWALRIVQSLQQAFAGTNPFDTAIALAARNATAIIDSMARERGEAGNLKPITKMSGQQIASESARAQAKNDLITATHSPLWSKKVIEQNETTNRILENGFRTLLMLQGSKGQRRTAAREIASINLRDTTT